MFRRSGSSFPLFRLLRSDIPSSPFPDPVLFPLSCPSNYPMAYHANINMNKHQTAVNKFTGGFDGGGGFSVIFEAPVYQKASVERYVSSQAIPPPETFNSTNR